MRFRSLAAAVTPFLVAGCWGARVTTELAPGARRPAVPTSQVRLLSADDADAGSCESVVTIRVWSEVSRGHLVHLARRRAASVGANAIRVDSLVLPKVYEMEPQKGPNGPAIYTDWAATFHAFRCAEPQPGAAMAAR
jgi:hypothetical protein